MKAIAQGDSTTDAPTSGVVEEPAQTSTSQDNSNPGLGRFSNSRFRVTVNIQEGYDDNVYAMRANPIGSFFSASSALVGYNFVNDRTNVDLQLNAGATYYYYRPFGQQYDLNEALTLNASHHITPRLSLGAEIYLAYQSEPDFRVAAGTNQQGGNFFFSRDKFSLTYAWTPRFSTVTSYTLGVVQYEEDFIGTFEDRVENTFGNEFRFLVFPTTVAVGEYRYELIDYDISPYDSTTHFVLGGIDQTFTPRFNLSVRGGLEFRDITGFRSETSPYGEMTLNYAASERLGLSWTNRYGFEQPSLPFTPTRTTFRTGLNAKYSITARTSIAGSAYYEHDDNAGILSPRFVQPPFVEQSLDLSVGVHYEINHRFALTAGYTHTQITSGMVLREYVRNRYYIGLDVTF